MMDEIIKKLEQNIEAYQLVINSDVVQRLNSEEYMNGYIDGIKHSLHILRQVKKEG